MKRKTKQHGFDSVTIGVGVTGSIAAFKSAELVSRLKQRGAEVVVIMTAAAREFVSPTTFRTLSRNPVVEGLFDPVCQWEPLHISLADRIDCLVIAPATANIIGKIAAGIADDALTALVLSTEKPVLIAPAMNARMFQQAVVQDNIRRLKRRGYVFIPPEKGFLACGYEGMGRLTALEKIIREIKRQL